MDYRDLLKQHAEWLNDKTKPPVVWANYDLYFADMRGADLRWADFRGAFMREINLEGADLTGADLRDTVLIGAKMRDAIVVGANFTGTMWGTAQEDWAKRNHAICTWSAASKQLKGK